MGISAYSQVSIPSGAARAEDIAPGDTVHNPASGGTATVAKVWQGPGVGMVRIAAENGCSIDLTADQRLATADGVVAAGDVRPGASLTTTTGQSRCIEAAAVMGDYMVYDIVLEDAEPALAVNGFVISLA